MPQDRKTPADIRREALALLKPAHPEPVEGRAPNQRQFTLNDDYAKTLCRPPSALPKFPHYAPTVIWTGEDPVPERPGKRRPRKGRK